MIYAKPSTSLLVVFRAYLASDHVTPATSKTIAVTISKNGGAFGNLNVGATNATEISGGFYKVTLDTTDTGTAGPLAVRGTNADIDDVGVLFYVGQAPADVTHFGGTAATTSGGRPEVNTTHAAGTAWGSGAITAGSIASDAITAAKIATGAIDADAIAADAITAAKIADGAIDAATFASGAINASAIASDAITAAKIADGAIDAATFAANAITATVLASDCITAAKIDGTAISEIQSGLATASVLSGVETKIDTIDTVVDAILVDTAEIGTAGAGLTNINLPDQAMNITGNITGNLSGSVGSVTGNVGGNVTGSVGSLATQAKADVNAEVLDVLNTDTFAEPGQEAPAATNTLVKKIGYLFKLLRNKITQTSTTLSIYDDAGTTVDQKATISDDGTTYTRGEIGTGP